MADIYWRAYEVVVWLGVETRYTPSLLDLIKCCQARDTFIELQIAGYVEERDLVKAPDGRPTLLSYA